MRAISTVTTVVALSRACTAFNLVAIGNPDAQFSLLLGLDWCNNSAARILFNTRTLSLDLVEGDMMSVHFKLDGRESTSTSYLGVGPTAAEEQQPSVPNPVGVMKGPLSPANSYAGPNPARKDFFRGGGGGGDIWSDCITKHPSS